MRTMTEKLVQRDDWTQAIAGGSKEIVGQVLIVGLILDYGIAQHQSSEHDVPDIIRSRSRACGVCQSPQGQIARCFFAPMQSS